MWGRLVQENKLAIAVSSLANAFESHMKEEEKDRHAQHALLKETNKTLSIISDKVTKLETDLLVQQERHQTDRHESANVIMTHVREKYVTKELLAEKFKIFGILWIGLTTVIMLWINFKQ